MDSGNHTHNARNEGSENLVVLVTYMLREVAPHALTFPTQEIVPSSKH